MNCNITYKVISLLEHLSLSSILLPVAYKVYDSTFTAIKMMFTYLKFSFTKCIWL